MILEGKIKVKSFNFETEQIMVDDSASIQEKLNKLTTAVCELPEGLEIKGLISIFNYNFEQADNNFKDAKCEKTSLCDYNILINEALKEKYIEKKDIELLKEWRIDPSIWGN